MKRAVSLILSAVVLLFTIYFPVQVDATEVSTTKSMNYTGNEVIELACSIWPQYAHKLNVTGENSQAPRMVANNNIDRDEVVHRETYKLSETDTIEYIEYESGFAVAAVISYWTETYTYQSTITEIIGGELVIANGVHVAHLIDFKYNIIYDHVEISIGTNDEILTTGTWYKSNVQVVQHGYQRREEFGPPHSYAYYTCQINFINDEYLVGSVIANLRVGYDSFYWSVA